ncbi:MAG: minor capsid protein, partial [Oscillospiraceae bacterium]
MCAIRAKKCAGKSLRGIRGDNIRDMSRAVADSLNSSYRSAERLVRTETSHIHNTAEIAAYEAAGYEEYEFMASLGERTCEVCGSLDGQHFRIADIQYGVNFPPVHPNCRCTTVGWDGADELEGEAFEQIEGQKQLDYEEWKRLYVDDRVEIEIPKQPEPPSPVIPAAQSAAVQTLTTGGDSGIIKKRTGADRAAEFSKNWQTLSLSEKVSFYGLDLVSPVTPTGKVIYSSDKSPIRIVYDVNGNYFRIVDTTVSGKGKNLGADGKSALNKTVNGKTTGRSRDEFQQVTHFNNGDKE